VFSCCATFWEVSGVQNLILGFANEFLRQRLENLENKLRRIDFQVLEVNFYDQL